MWEEPEEEGSTDRRKERRWNIPVPVRVRGHRADGTEFEEETITADASPSGMCLLLTVEMAKGDPLTVTAPEEQFESSATVIETSSLGPNMHRVRVQFPRPKKFGRAAAQKKYVYDYGTDSWVGYISEGTYYNTKHEPFGKVEDKQIIALDSGQVLFKISLDRVYDQRMNCIGHLI